MHRGPTERKRTHKAQHTPGTEEAATCKGLWAGCPQGRAALPMAGMHLSHRLS